MINRLRRSKRGSSLIDSIEQWANELPGNVYWKSIDGIYLGCNDSFLNLLQFKSKEMLVGKSDRDLWPLSAKSILENDNTVLTTKQQHHFDEELMLSKNEILHLVTFKKLLRNNANETIGILCTASPTTELKTELIQTLQEKEKIESDNKTILRYLQDIISAVPGSIYWKNKEGVYLGCNDYMVKTAGLNAKEDIIGKTDAELWPKQAVELCHTDIKVMNVGQAIQLEESVTLPNGKTRYFIVGKMPLRDSDGNIAGIIGNSLEITDLKETQTALEAANMAKTEFLANMSHDIRTPLAGVVGMSELLENDLENTEQKEYAHLLRDSSTELLGLLNHIIDDVRAGNDHEEETQSEVFSLRQCIQHLIKLELPTTKLKHLNLEANIDQDIPAYIEGDSIKLHRILLNLLGNAIKFTEKGNITIEVNCLSEHDNIAHIEFKVIDTGIGIPEDKQEKVFDRFFRISPSYKGLYKGHGLGLHIAQSYVNLLGGEITLLSQVGVGTTFTFDLKFKIVDRIDVETKEGKLNATSSKPETHYEDQTLAVNDSQITSFNKSGPTVLLVEDNPIALKVAETIAIKIGWRFISAINGEHALELAKNQDFDLIITDIGLPGMSGQEFTQHLRVWENLQKKEKTPVIGLTGHARESAKKECLECGMDDIFTKPATNALFQTLRERFFPTREDISKPMNRSVKKLGFELPSSEEELFNLDAFPIFEPKQALEQIGGNKALMVNTIQLFVENVIPDEFAHIQDAYNVKDWNKIQNLAHKIKGGAVYCGVPKMKQACQYLERYHKAGHEIMLDKLYHQFIEVTKKTEQAIIQWLQNE